MVNAPPTPPPTTATELQDQSRNQPQASSSNPPAPASSLSTADDSFPATFPLIVDLAGKAQYHELLLRAEETDVLSNSSRSPSRLFTVSPLVLTYLIVDNIPPAQYALSRLPDPLLAMPLTKALLELVSATAERRYSQIYARAEALFNLVAQPNFSDTKLASLIANLVTNFLETFRERTFALISKAYSSLPLSLAQIYLGLPGEQIVRAAEQHGWIYDVSSQILEPKPMADASPSAAVQNLPISSLSAFKFIADSVGELEA
ncbi:COP9 signalosome complex subunit 8 [Leucoagaricus sp. SymC.cos]|nr:COP9 signalosome complex subunit 8 [Leucoagaricus sp. SymC.cos]